MKKIITKSIQRTRVRAADFYVIKKKMAKRKLLNGVVAGLATTFVSRYNNINGYWALGIMYSIASETNNNVISLDLKQNVTVPNNKKLQKLSSKYYDKLKLLLKVNKLNLSCCEKIVIKITFDVSCTKNHLINRFTYGNPYTCIASIIDDLGKIHEHIVVGWCAKHNPLKESRSWI